MSVEAIRAGAVLAPYGGIICDLDGVVYRGDRAVVGAPETLRAAFLGHRRIAFATNNASRTPAEVMAHLRGLGVEAPDAATGSLTVVTSAQAAAQYVAARTPPASLVLAVGGAGVVEALRGAGLTPTRAPLSAVRVPVAAVVQGAGAAVTWRDLAEAAYQVQAGALWVATNLDATIPTGRGLAPGNGALVAAVRGAVEVEPKVMGKPHRPLYDVAMEWLGLEPATVLVVGDRLDTDIAGAVHLGLDSLFVLSGAHRLVDLVYCDPSLRPTRFASDVRALLRPCEASGRLETLVRDAWALLDAGGEPALAAGDWGRVEERIHAEWAASWG